jgi:quercetin dioxygenase-like cupin family protein
MAPQSAPLADAVQYQDGGVVSRTLLNKKSGSVTLFAFDRGERLSEHTAPFDALVCLIEGEMEITISGQASRLQAGDFIVMPANKPHALDAVQKSKVTLVMLKS